MSTKLSEHGKRKKFKTSFDDYISNELQRRGVFCWLRHKYNWFAKVNKNILWRGKFRCINKNCPIIFNSTIQKDTESGVNLSINWEHMTPMHLKLKRPVRCIGKDRKRLATELMAQSNSNVKQDHDLSNFLNVGF